MTTPVWAISDDFARCGEIDPRTSFSRASADALAWERSDRGIWRSRPSNAPRFHCDANGVPLGLLLELGTTQHVQNPLNVGGATGSPGTDPTLVFISTGAGGVNRTVQSIGPHPESGRPSIVMRFDGTPTSSSNVIMRWRAIGSWVVDEPYAIECEVELLQGSFANTVVNAASWAINGFNIANSVASVPVPTIGGGAVRWTRRGLSSIIQTITASHGPWLVFPTTINQPIDFTIRVSAVQMQKRQYINGMIAPPGAPAGATQTMGEDRLTYLFSDFALPTDPRVGTILLRGRTPPFIDPAATVMADLDTGTPDNRIRIQRLTTGAIRATVTEGAIVRSNVTSAVVPDDTDVQVAYSWQAGSAELIVNGAAPNTGAPAAVPICNQMALAAWGGTIAGVNLAQRRLSNTALRALTS